MDIVRAEGLKRLEVNRARVVLVEDPDLAVVEREAGVAEGTVGRGDQRR